MSRIYDPQEAARLAESTRFVWKKLLEAEAKKLEAAARQLEETCLNCEWGVNVQGETPYCERPSCRWEITEVGISK